MLFLHAGALKNLSKSLFQGIDKVFFVCYHIKVGNSPWFVRAFFAQIRPFRKEDGLMETLKNSSNRVVGKNQVLRAMKAGKLQRAYVANDVDTYLFQQVIRTAESCQVPVTRVATMKELGEACGVQVATAAAGIVKP